MKMHVIWSIRHILEEKVASLSIIIPIQRLIIYSSQDLNHLPIIGD